MKFSKSKLPKTWEQLVALKNDISFIDVKYLRFYDDEFFYHEYRRLVPKEVRYQIIYNSMGNSDHKIVRNEFPYGFLIQHLLHVNHYCLWSKTGPLSVSTIESEIKKTFPNCQFFWFENNIATKTVPEIWHCQVFVKED